MKARWMGMASLACVVAWALLTGVGRAQDGKPASAGAKSGKEEVKGGRLPMYFGQIGLSKKQEEDVRKAAQPFDEKIVQVRKQIAELEKQMDELDAEKVVACEKVLTDGQRSALAARREQAESEKASRKKKANSDTSKSDELKP
jgi:Spy/CpxP family protein refolding chaperone